MSLILLSVPAARTDASGPPVFRSTNSQFIFLRPVRPAPKATLGGIDGVPVELAHFRSRVVVLNFWASWCLPCAYEMPSLDRLAASADRTRLGVLAVAIDRDGAASVAPFARSHSLTRLVIGLDPGERLGSLDSDHVAMGALPLWGLPITYLIDKHGNVIGYVNGAADWDAPAARAFLDYFINAD
jgi:thiol-disulfide isomerase/thioredoxin